MKKLLEIFRRGRKEAQGCVNGIKREDEDFNFLLGALDDIIEEFDERIKYLERKI